MFNFSGAILSHIVKIVIYLLIWLFLENFRINYNTQWCDYKKLGYCWNYYLGIHSHNNISEIDYLQEVLQQYQRRILMIFIKFWAFSPFLILFLIVLIQEVMVIYTYLNPSQTEGIFLVVHHLLLFLIIYTFCLVMKTDAGRPCRPSQSQNEENHKLINLKICKYCQIEKPTRCHHCRQCNRCVLRMDHHCPWVNNCIGQNNYKAFFCLITYSTILSVLYSICYMIKVLSIIEFGHIEIYFIIFNCTLSFAVSILLLLFLGFHLRLISNNQTTLEYFEKNTNYDKGMCNNFQEFLGPSFWLFP